MASESEAQRALQYEQTLVSTGDTGRARDTGVAQDATRRDGTPGCFGDLGVLPCSGRQNSAVPCLGCCLLFGMSSSAPLRLWRSLAEPPSPGQDFCRHLTTPWQHPPSLGRDAQPVGAPRGASRARFSPHCMSPALCPQDKVSPSPATLAPCLQLEASPLAPGCPIVLGCPPSPLCPQSLHCSSLPTALKHHGQRCFSRASSWDSAQGERYFALAKAFRPAGPVRCAGKQGLRGYRVVVPTAAQESPSRLLGAGRTPLSLTHPAWAHGAASGHCCSQYLGIAFPSSQTLLAVPLSAHPKLPLCRRCQVSAGHPLAMGAPAVPSSPRPY